MRSPSASSSFPTRVSSAHSPPPASGSRDPYPGSHSGTTPSASRIGASSRDGTASTPYADSAAVRAPGHGELGVDRFAETCSSGVIEDFGERVRSAVAV